MASSSAPAAKAALVSLLQADPGMTGVTVTYGHPGSEMQQECVWTGMVTAAEQAISLGNMLRDEAYTIQVMVLVAQDGDDAQACEERCLALVAVVENVVRANVQLAGTVNQWAVIEAFKIEPGFSSSGAQRITTADVSVGCRHRK